jgi:glycosyltransferase involved in cell wall biosynthesis
MHTAVEPLVSVGVPVYNHERFIESCLDSIVASTYRRLEIVVIDDGSTDRSFEVALDWGERHRGQVARLETIRQENAGVTKTLNRLAGLMKGEYLIFLASDDLLLPDGIWARLEALQKRPEWLAVFGDSRTIDAEGRILHASSLQGIFGANRRALQSDEHRAMELILRWSAPGPVLMLRREALATIGGFDESTLVEDRDFYLRLLARNALGFIDVPVSCYRVHEAGTVQSNRTNRRIQEAVAQAEVANSNRFAGAQRWLLKMIGRDSLASLCFKESRWPIRALYYVHRSAHKAWLRLFAALHDAYVWLAADRD